MQRSICASLIYLWKFEAVYWIKLSSAFCLVFARRYRSRPSNIWPPSDFCVAIIFISSTIFTVEQNNHFHISQVHAQVRCPGPLCLEVLTTSNNHAFCSSLFFVTNVNLRPVLCIECISVESQLFAKRYCHPSSKPPIFCCNIFFFKFHNPVSILSRISTSNPTLRHHARAYQHGGVHFDGESFEPAHVGANLSPPLGEDYPNAHFFCRAKRTNVCPSSHVWVGSNNSLSPTVTVIFPHWFSLGRVGAAPISPWFLINFFYFDLNDWFLSI